MDVVAIEPGRDFRKAIEESVHSCSVLLAVIGQQWLESTDDRGRRRLDDQGDYLRLEIASALRRDIPVVPVLVHGARMPRADQLPADLQNIAYRNAVELTHARWKSDLQVLAQALKPYMGVTEAPSPPPIPKRKKRWKRVVIAAAVLLIAFALYLVYASNSNPISNSAPQPHFVNEPANGIGHEPAHAGNPAPRKK
jgi:hypothetical protein